MILQLMSVPPHRGSSYPCRSSYPGFVRGGLDLESLHRGPVRLMSDALRTWTRGRTVVVIAGWAWLAAATLLSSDVGVPGGVLTVCTMLVVGLVVGVAWAVVTLLWLGNLWTWRGVLLWLTVPAAPGLSAVGACTAWPLAVRVWLSESALRAHVEQNPIDPFEWVTDLGPKRIGLFWVNGIDRDSDETVTFSTGEGLRDEGGLLFAPRGVPGRFRNRPVSLTHLYGSWYRFTPRREPAVVPVLATRGIGVANSRRSATRPRAGCGAPDTRL